MSVFGPHVVLDDEPDADAMVGVSLRLHGFDVALRGRIAPSTRSSSR